MHGRGVNGYFWKMDILSFCFGVAVKFENTKQLSGGHMLRDAGKCIGPRLQSRLPERHLSLHNVHKTCGVGTCLLFPQRPGYRKRVTMMAMVK